jgi:hypothetical protein
MVHGTVGLHRSAILFTVLTTLVGCGGGGDHSSNSNTGGGGTTYSVGGTVSGLTGSGFVLRNAHAGNGDDLGVSGNGTFTFATPLPNGSAYVISVFTQPVGQTCTVANGSATISGANVTNVAVTCVASGGPTYTVGGTVSGLTGSGLSLRNSNFGGLGGSYDYLSVSGNGTFTFAAPLFDRTPFLVEVATQPSGEICSVTSGSGTISGANVTNVAVTCVASGGGTNYTVGGTVSGLTGTGLVLRNNGGNDLPVSANGSFHFSTALASGPYSVTVYAQPSGQTCTVTNGSGSISGAAVTNVAVTCVASGGGGVCGGGSITIQGSCDYRAACSARGEDCACTDFAQASALTLDAMKTSCTTPDQSGLVGVWSTSPCPTAGRVGTCIFDVGDNLDVNRYYTAAAAAGNGSWCPGSGGCWIPN